MRRTIALAFALAALVAVAPAVVHPNTTCSSSVSCL